MLKKLGINSISDVLNWIMTFANTLGGKEVTKEVRSRIPGFLGLSLEDERLFASIRTHLSDEEDMHLTDFLNACKDYERNRFRNIVSGMPDFEEKTITRSEKNQKVTVQERNNAISFIKRIAFLVENYGPEEARRRCLSGGVIIENPIERKALEQWRNSVKWFKEKILKVFGVQSLSEIDLKLANKKFDELVKELETKAIDPILKPVEEYIEKERKKRWYARMFTFF
ncbi:hypothetical protein KAU09_01700 [Candidatus Parcubacteria bacterium]|nr:hypothetical protein [Candidatus Parcubacteria bacterium]